MHPNPCKVGAQIALLRKSKQLTQAELGERVNVSFQAVSKWERGETLPDVGILLDLASVLQTTVDNLLTGGEKLINYKGRINVADIKEGLACLGKVGSLLGKNNILYRCAVEGINEKMNTTVEECFTDDRIFECFMAEAILHNLMEGAYIDVTDVKNSFKYSHFSDIVCDYAEKYNIK